MVSLYQTPIQYQGSNRQSPQVILAYHGKGFWDPEELERLLF